MNISETTVKTERVFSGEVLTLRVDTVRTPGGNEATREVVEHPGGVAVVALTDKGEVVMERQYRRPLDKIILEIPAGKLFKGEDPKECALRELEEETGLKARDLKDLGFIYPSPGFCDERLYLYLADKLERGEMNRDADEYLEIENIPIDQVADMILKGELHDAKTCIAVLRVWEMMKNGGLTNHSPE